MTAARKSADVREKELRMAILRIQRGRARTEATKVNFSSVAREAGVTPALIHNHYPTIAEAIREATGRSARDLARVQGERLKEEALKNKALREQVRTLQKQVAQIASRNEMLHNDLRIARAQLQDPKVVSLDRKLPPHVRQR